MIGRRRRQEELWRDTPDTADDAILIGRAMWLLRDYSALRLHLARFAWCAEGVEARARVVLRDWGRRVFAVLAEDARKLDVPLERYVRNLLPVIPQWIVPLVIVLARRDRSIARKLGGLRLDDRDFPTHKAQIRNFGKLYAARTPLGPDTVQQIVNLREEAANAAVARWKLRGLTMATPGKTPSGPGPRLRPTPMEVLERAIASACQGKGIAAADKDRLASWIRRANTALREAIRRILPGTRLPAQPLADLLAIMPRRPRHHAILALRLYAVGRAGMAAELAPMSYKRATATLGAFERVAGRQLYDLLASAVMPSATTIPRAGLAAALDGLVRWSGSGERIATLLPLAAARRGRRRHIVAKLIAGLGKSRPDEFAEFIATTTHLRVDWSELPVDLREAALEAWMKVMPKQPEMRARAARILPKLALEAARWAGDDDALMDLIRGRSAAPALALLARRDAAEADRIWAQLSSTLRGRPDLPAPWIVAARKDPRVLDLLIRKDLPRLARSRLDGLALPPLMEASLRSRGLASRLATAYDATLLAAAMPALRRRLVGKTLRRAAAELALHLGWEHATALAFLATRPFAPKERPGTRFDGLYHSWDIPKRKGGVRRITAPAPLLKQIQRRLLDAILAQAPCHDAATGFRRGISIADNARAHVGRRIVVNVDIQGFFPNTRFGLVARAVEKALPRGLSAEGRRLAIDICTMGGGLPTGAPTSPVVANLVMAPVDRTLATVAARHGVAYTRYADDLTLSGDDPRHLLPFLSQVVGELGYSLDPKKTNIFRRGRRQVVTGLVVNDKVSVPRRLRRQLRAAVHRVARQGGAAELSLHGRPMSVGELAGHVAFIGVAHPEESRSLARQLRERRATGHDAPETDTP